MFQNPFNCLLAKFIKDDELVLNGKLFLFAGTIKDWA
jgi:hypothetical protein